MQEAVEAARGGFDGFVGVGGGSALDTAKLCALFATHGGELLDYVNAPIGAGRPVPGPVLPVVALPTTSGTGSEVTTVAIVDFPRLGTKTGISHRYLRPIARNRRPVPDGVVPAPADGVDRHRRADARARGVHGLGLRHAARSSRFSQRPPYQGANPFSDPLCERAIELIGEPASALPSRAATTSSRAPRWRWRRRSPGSRSPAPACTFRTPSPIRSRRSSTTGGRRATEALRSCRTASRSP